MDIGKIKQVPLREIWKREDIDFTVWLENNIITYLTKNGTIDKEMLFEQPFTDESDQGIMGIFTEDAEVRSIIRIIATG